MALGDANTALIQQGFQQAPAFGNMIADQWAQNAPLNEAQQGFLQALRPQPDEDSAPFAGGGGLGAPSVGLPEQQGSGLGAPARMSGGTFGKMMPSAPAEAPPMPAAPPNALRQAPQSQSRRGTRGIDFGDTSKMTQRDWHAVMQTMPYLQQELKSGAYDDKFALQDRKFEHLKGMLETKNNFTGAQKDLDRASRKDMATARIALGYDKLDENGRQHVDNVALGYARLSEAVDAVNAKIESQERQTGMKVGSDQRIALLRAGTGAEANQLRYAASALNAASKMGAAPTAVMPEVKKLIAGMLAENKIGKQEATALGIDDMFEELKSKPPTAQPSQQVVIERSGSKSSGGAKAVPKRPMPQLQGGKQPIRLLQSKPPNAKRTEYVPGRDRTVFFGADDAVLGYLPGNHAK